MSAAGLLLELTALGIEVDAHGGMVRCRHAPRTLPAELAARVRARRQEVLALLADPDALRLAAARELFGAAEERVRCRACGTERGATTPTCPVCHPRPGVGTPR